MFNITDNGINAYTTTDNGKKTTLTNFIWNITEDIKTISACGVFVHIFKIKGININNITLPEIEVTAKEFDAGGWERRWGTEAIIYDNALYKKVVYPTNKGSSDIIRRTACDFTGFFYHDGKLCHVDSNGMMNGDTWDPNFRSNLKGRLGLYGMPEPTEDSQYFVACIKHCLEINNLSNDCFLPFSVLIPPMLVLIGLFIEIDFSISIRTQDGDGSNTPALAMMFFGSDFKYPSQFPIDWSWSEKQIIDILCSIKKSLLVIDNLMNSTEEMTTGEQNNRDMKKKYVNVISSLFSKSHVLPNASKAEILDKAVIEPVLVSVSKSTNWGINRSIFYRSVFFNIDFDKVDKEQLEMCMTYASNGEYAQVLSNYIQFLLKNHEAYRLKTINAVEKYEKKFINLIRDSGTKQHERSAHNFSIMMAALSLFYKLAHLNMAITDEERKTLMKKATINLTSLLFAQTGLRKQYRVGEILLNGIEQGLVKGVVHLLDFETGKKPQILSEHLKYVGWRSGKPEGEFIGWIDTKNQEVYISKHTPIKVLKDLIIFEEERDLFPNSKSKFWILIKNDGYLKNRDKEHNSTKKRNPNNQEQEDMRNIDIDLFFFNCDDYQD